MTYLNVRTMFTITIYIYIYIMPHQWKMNFTVFSALTWLPRSGKSQGNSSLSQRQGILLQVREFCCKSGNFVICYKSQGKVRKFHLCCLSTHIFHHLANYIWTRTKSWIRFSLKNHLPNDFFQNFISFHVLHNVRHKISTIFKMLKMFSCADLFSRPLCWSIY